ncbi:glycosyltransferase [Campylobacter devanensis]|uniref:glycosyltransferase n=1 Tax=Campylobacter devanensis TaxID=3161138 RepID=UPI00191C7353|nr:glycosyltransferase [Campylobacter sp. P090]
MENIIKKMGGGIDLSFVVPCYNESLNLDNFYLEILNQINIINEQNSKQINCEFIFINDGSMDNTLEILDNLALKDNRVRILNFSRNFGKEAAILAGLQNSSAKATILILFADTFFAFNIV